MSRLILLLSFAPGVALASNGAALFVLFFGIPALIVSILLVFLSSHSPKKITVCASIFLVAWISIRFFVFRAADLGSDSGWFYAPCAIGGIALWRAIDSILMGKTPEKSAEDER